MIMYKAKTCCMNIYIVGEQVNKLLGGQVNKDSYLF